LEMFFQFLADHFPHVLEYQSITRLHVISYKTLLMQNEMAPKTVIRKLASISSFFDFLMNKNVLEYNPTDSIKRPRDAVLKPTNDLSDEQVSNLFAQLHELRDEKLMHKALLYTLFTTGLRKSELTQLKWGHIEKVQEHSLFRIKAKGGKVLSKVIHPFCLDILRELESYQQNSGFEMGPEHFIFRPSKNPTQNGNLNRALNPKTVDYILDLYAKKAGIHTRISPHSARATYIGSALESGVDLYKISKDVGHASVKTTEEYNKRRNLIKDSPVWGIGYLKKDKAAS